VLTPRPHSGSNLQDIEVNSTILVTGGAGFIGGCFVRRLIEQTDATVVNLDKLTYAGNLDSIPPSDDVHHHFCQGDICDTNLVMNLLNKHNPSAIVHFAAESHVDRSIDGPREFVQTNVLGTFELLLAAQDHWSKLSSKDRQCFRFLHVSTDEVYGSLGDNGKFTETTRYDPHSPYSASKASSDHFVRAFHATYGLPTVITNCSNNYGPYQFPEKLIPLITLNALEGKPLPVYGRGENVRDWLFVEDHCRAIEVALQRGLPGETYNIGGNCEQSNLEVVRQICNLVDELDGRSKLNSSHRLIEFVQDRPGHDFRYAIDSSKIERDLSWSPAETFDTGLRRTVQWYLDNNHWVERVTSGKYQRERLGKLST
jgi:dTDP-glucose 4,6-dehydratase